MEQKSKNPVYLYLKDFLKAKIIPISVLVLMCIVAFIASPIFLSWVNIENLFVQAATTMLVSMGMLMVILTGGIDLSVGSIVALSGVMVALLMQRVPLGIAILLSVLSGGLVGVVNGIFVSFVGIAPFIVTLGMQNLARGIAYWLCQSQPIPWFTFDNGAAFNELGSGRLGKIPYLVIIWIVVAFITYIILQHTVWGRIVYSIGGNKQAVKLSGIRAARWSVLPYLYSGLCSGLAGVLLSARLGVGAPTSGTSMETDAIAAVIVGGTSFNGGVGTVSGAIIGVFIMAIIGNILDLMNVQAYPQMMLKGVILVAAVALSEIRDKNKS